jgi:hypothetical protein
MMGRLFRRQLAWFDPKDSGKQTVGVGEISEAALSSMSKCLIFINRPCTYSLF